MGKGINMALSSVQDIKTEERFYCERFKCDMSKRTCVSRQKLMSGPVHSSQKEKAARIRIECADCSQGKEVAQQYDQQVRAEKGRLKLASTPGASGKTDYTPPEPVVLQKTKKCCICKDHKSLDQFYKRSSSRDGLQNYCKKCSKKTRPEYRKKEKKPDHGRSHRTHKKGVIEIDFASNPELFNKLLKSAKDAFRTPENHIMWLINEYMIVKEKKDRESAEISEMVRKAMNQ